MLDLVVVGAGPGGIFAALQAKTISPGARVVVLEKSSSLLSKVKVSGGGRCNVTNASFDPRELCLNYPRGNKELLSAFARFQPRDMIQWLEQRGVKLKVESEGRVFPLSDDSETIIECFLKEIKRVSLEIRFNSEVKGILKNGELFEIDVSGKKIYAKRVILATGGSVKGLALAKILGHRCEPFIPSLFSFRIKESAILKLYGTSKKGVKVSLSNSPYYKEGDILITHEGFSGPAIINLSSLAAKFLFEKNYDTKLSINWLGDLPQEEVFKELAKLKISHPRKRLQSISPFTLPHKLWLYFLDFYEKDLLPPLGNISHDIFKKIAIRVTSDEYSIISKSLDKDEFVSCGGIDLKDIDFKDMQSKICENLFFVGEILNIDGFTGGYNLQNAWTTGFIAGNSLSLYRQKQKNFNLEFFDVDLLWF